MVPVPTTFATALPLIEPNRALPKIATLAGPPLNFPNPEFAQSRKKSLPPRDSKSCPNIKKINTCVVDTPNTLLKIPSVVIYPMEINFDNFTPACRSSANGILEPK